LIEEGFTPKINEAIALKVTHNNGNDTYEAVSTVLPFKSKAQGGGLIIHISYPEEAQTFAIIIRAFDNESRIEVYTVDEQGNVISGAGSDCSAFCGTLAGMTIFSVCCFFFCLCPINWYCLPICGASAAVLATIICNPLCGDLLTWCALGCAAACGAICSPLSGFEGMMCGLACNDICSQVLSRYCD